MSSRKTANLATRLLVTFVSATVALPASISLAFAQSTNSQQQMGSYQPQPGAAKLTEAQLAALVAPIALYPDPLVSQVLMASTYPLEVAEAYNWQRSNSRLSGSALSQALQQQNWDPSVKSLVSFAPVLGMMGTQLSWTQNLGNAVLAQQSDVMSAIQDLRAKAQASGALKSNAQQTVTTQNSNGGQTIIIQPANPQVVYVPTYNPNLVYGAWGYPAYPPYSYYPPDMLPEQHCFLLELAWLLARLSLVVVTGEVADGITGVVAGEVVTHSPSTTIPLITLIAIPVQTGRI